MAAVLLSVVICLMLFPYFVRAGESLLPTLAEAFIDLFNSWLSSWKDLLDKLFNKGDI